jgi:hypothetical protein
MPVKVKKGQTAIVIGSSWAGMMSTRVLLNHFEKVIVIESDSQPEFGPIEFQKNIVQHRHAHVILTLTFKILEKLFPNARRILQKQGSCEIDFGESKWFNYGGYVAAMKVFFFVFLVSSSFFPSFSYFSCFYFGSWIKNSITNLLCVICSRPAMDCAVRKDLLDEYQDRVRILYNTTTKGLVRKSNIITGVTILESDGKTTTEISGDFVVDATGRSAKGKH